MSFLQAEKRRQTEWKLRTRDLSRRAKAPGLLGNRLLPFCLPVDQAAENLWAGVRSQMIDYFQTNSVVWHTGALPGYPSNHLCSSQVFLANLLGPFQSRRELLHRLMVIVYPDLTGILPIESPDRFLAFEWVPPVDLLEEGPKLGPTSMLKRGVGNTSIDFVLLGRIRYGRNVLVLGESKYTEHYPARLVDSQTAAKRMNRYQPLIGDAGWVRPATDEQVRMLATEPVYQLLRHHLLATQLLEHCQPIDEVRLLHLYVGRGKGVDDENSPVLRSHPGMELLKDSPIRLQEISAQRLLRHVRSELPEELREWERYMNERYRL